MPSDINLETVIEDAISDTYTPDVADNAEVVDTPTEGVDASSETVDTPTDDAAIADGGEDTSIEVASPAARQGQESGPNFAMDKKLGIPSHTNGRENRIPYSRVKKIVENAEKPHLAKLAEIEPKIQQYEQQLQKVAEFEQVMVNQPRNHMQMLQSLPAYQPFFQALNDMQTELETLRQKSLETAQKQEQVVDNDPMPEPDDKTNGVYTMDGLKNLLAWQSRQVEAQVTKKVTSQYDPIRKEWEAQQQLNQMIPQVEAQIREARTWPAFTENEQEIVQILNKYPNSTLEAAYRHVVLPKLQVDRNKMRQELLEELKKAPPVTSAPARPTRTSPQVTPSGPRSLEDVIRESVSGIGNR